MTLTEQQQHVFNNFRVFMKEELSLAIFSGCAGSGKTFTLLECLKSDPTIEVAMLASTNSAVKNVRKATQGLGSLYGTVHSFLGLSPNVPEWTEDDEMELQKLHGNISSLSSVETRKLNRLEQQKKAYLSDDMSFLPSGKEQGSYDLVIIDEAFMLNAEVVDSVAGYSRGTGTKVIFVGDSFQLPPVNEKESKIFSLPIDPKNQWHLTEVVRYDGAVLAYATAIRESLCLPPHQAYQTQVNYYPFVDNETVFACPFQQVKPQIKELYAEGAAIHFLAYKNDTVDTFNLKIREILGSPLDSYVAGDQLISHEKVGRDSENRPSHYYGDSYVTTSTYLTVYEVVSSKEVTFFKVPTKKSITYKGQWLKVKNEDGNSYLVFVIVPNDYVRWKQDKKAEGSKIRVFSSSAKGARGQSGQAAKEVWEELGLKNWNKKLDGSEVTASEYNGYIKAYKRNFAALCNLADPIQLAYAITIHKSQGRTIDYVFLAKELFEPRTHHILQENYPNLLYTGVTRTAKQLIILE